MKLGKAPFNARHMLATALLVAPLSAVANYVEFGGEFERYNSDYDGDDINMPYVAFGLTPFKGSPFNISGHSSYADRLDDDQNGNDRTRQEFFVGYKWEMGSLTFAPQVGIRHESYSAGHSASEYRIFPGLKYSLSENTVLELGGFVAPMTSKAQDRSIADTGELETYSGDWKHELEYGLTHKLPSGDSFEVSFYNEVIKSDKAGREGVEESRNEWQFRLGYSHRIDNQWTVTPWARIGLHREKEDAIGQQKDEIRHRAGFDVGYKIDNAWSVSTRLYAQKEEKEDWSGNAVTDKDSDKWRHYLKVGIRRSF